MRFDECWNESVIDGASRGKTKIRGIVIELSIKVSSSSYRPSLPQIIIRNYILHLFRYIFVARIFSS